MCWYFRFLLLSGNRDEAFDLLGHSTKGRHALRFTTLSDITIWWVKRGRDSRNSVSERKGYTLQGNFMTTRVGSSKKTGKNWVEVSVKMGQGLEEERHRRTNRRILQNKSKQI